MNTTPPTKKTTSKIADLNLAFDIGHSSIGWAVLENKIQATRLHLELPKVLATGVLLFPADDCLASVRRLLRSQRRHLRSTRFRISRLAKFLAPLLDVIEPKLAAELRTYRTTTTHSDLQGKGHPAPWVLAARVLRDGKPLTWPELWDVLRWYAHNRGYDAQVPWIREGIQALSERQQEELAKENKRQKKAVALMEKYNVETMAETVFCYLFDEAGTGRCHVDPRTVERLPFFQRYFKSEECIFPRHVVREEVKKILERHRLLIDSTAVSTDTFIHALLNDWHVLPEQFRADSPHVEKVWLPRRYGLTKRRERGNELIIERSYGGLLFGQFIPRFENRLIETCPFTFAKLYRRFLTFGLLQEEWNKLPKDLRDRLQPEQSLPEESARHLAECRAKVPSKASREFLQYRWVSLLADLTVQPKDGGTPRRLSPEELIAWP